MESRISERNKYVNRPRKKIKTIKYLSIGYFSCIVLAAVAALNHFNPLEDVSAGV
jgi:hypothetical protein